MPDPTAKSDNCPVCGFHFTKPKARCSDQKACAKRASLTGGDPAKLANAPRRVRRGSAAPTENDVAAPVVENPKLAAIKQRIADRAAARSATHGAPGAVLKIRLTERLTRLVDDLFPADAAHGTGRAGTWLIVPRSELPWAFDRVTNEKLSLESQISAMTAAGTTGDPLDNRLTKLDRVEALAASFARLSNAAAKANGNPDVVEITVGSPDGVPAAGGPAPEVVRPDEVIVDPMQAAADAILTIAQEQGPEAGQRAFLDTVSSLLS